LDSRRHAFGLFPIACRFSFCLHGDDADRVFVESRFKMTHSKWFGCLLLTGVLAGCGGDGIKRSPITGVLVLNGTPLAGASVEFTPQGSTQGIGAIGVSGTDGKFEVISSRRGDEGIPPGEYTVRVSLFANPDGTPLPPDATQADNPFAYEAIPTPYSGAGSPLKVSIPEAGGEVRIEVPAKLIPPKRRV
jgi:hypothetical protein